MWVWSLASLWAEAQAGSCSSDLTLSLGTSICHRFSPKKTDRQTDTHTHTKEWKQLWGARCFMGELAVCKATMRRRWGGVANWGQLSRTYFRVTGPPRRQRCQCCVYSIGGLSSAREAELRQLRKSNMEFEERNAALQKHVESMRTAVEKLEVDVIQERSRNTVLQQHLETLRQVLTSSFASMPLPGNVIPTWAL